MPMGAWNSWVTKKRWCVRTYTEKPFVCIMYIHYAREPQSGWAFIVDERLFWTLAIDLRILQAGISQSLVLQEGCWS